jgi:hypothetical protein
MPVLADLRIDGRRDMPSASAASSSTTSRAGPKCSTSREPRGEWTICTAVAPEVGLHRPKIRRYRPTLGPCLVRNVATTNGEPAGQRPAEMIKARSWPKSGNTTRPAPWPRRWSGPASPATCTTAWLTTSLSSWHFPTVPWPRSPAPPPRPPTRSGGSQHRPGGARRDPPPARRPADRGRAGTTAADPGPVRP